MLRRFVQVRTPPFQWSKLAAFFSTASVIPEMEWIRMAESRLSQTSSDALCKAIEELRAEHSAKYPTPDYSGFFGNVQLQAAVRVDDHQLVKDCFERYGLSNSITLSIIIKYYGNSGRLDTAMRLFQDTLKTRAVRLSIPVFRTMVNVACESNIGMAESVFKQWIEYWRANPEMDIAPTAESLHHVVKLMCRHSRLQGAEELLEEFEKCEPHGRIMWNTWSALLIAMIRNRELKRAYNRYKWIVTKYLPISPSPTDLSWIAAILRKNLSDNVAVQWLKEIEQGNAAPHSHPQP